MSNEVETKSNVEKLARAITQAGRHGLKRSSSFDPGVELAVEASTVLVTAAIVEQAISDLSPEPLQEPIRTLLRSRSESVQDLKPASLLKLRAILYLGLGEAQYVHPDERRESLVRTYTAYVPAGKPAPRGVEAFRVGKNNLSRAEREDLARLIAETVLDKLSKLQVSEDANFDSRFETTPHANDGDAFAIVKYVDQHVYPARGEGTMVVRRTRKLRALRDGVDSFTAHYATLSRTGPEWHPRITGFGDLTVSNVRKQAVDERTGYTYDVHIHFPALRRDEERTIEWQVESDWSWEDYGDPGAIADVKTVPSYQIENATISVVFAETRPDRIWKISDVREPSAREEKPDLEEVPLRNGVARETWQHLRMGRASGLVWRWGDLRR